MADPTNIAQGIITGVLTGGASAATTLLGVFKGLKKRISDLEEAVGSEEKDPKTGIFYTLEVMNDGLKRLRREIESWRDDPPDWLVRAAQRRSSVSMEYQTEIEQRVEARLRAFATTLRRYEDEIGLGNSNRSGFITRAEYEADSRARADEIAKIRNNVASANSLLRGVMADLGHIDEPPVKPTIKKKDTPNGR